MEIYYLDSISYMLVDIESMKRKQTLGECYNCQEFVHYSRLCSRNPRCMKCAGPHKSKDCLKPRDTPPKCLHCNGAHTASFTGCLKNPMNRKSFQVTPENAWS
ncbi:hypothetical protein AVEN_17248-1 [Araneus ventricosus]|uniref:Nucleic-acid-binding protein from transposon X-element n=1 Tax=Araneus ventricosus TaxID=182803 RepID=A0A4Y2HZ12_ARAVE|nr:hypothetical protein AVEN_17248-1 [Araneus ventricosus]